MTRKRKPTIEQRDWWPAALAELTQLAVEGYKLMDAAKIVGPKHAVSADVIRNASARGSVPAFPASDQARASAWARGDIRYSGSLCSKHNIRERYSNDGICVECMKDYSRTRNEKIQRQE